MAPHFIDHLAPSNNYVSVEKKGKQRSSLSFTYEKWNQFPKAE